LRISDLTMRLDGEISEEPTAIRLVAIG
jgi:hypothetical protein